MQLESLTEITQQGEKPQPPMVTASPSTREIYYASYDEITKTTRNWYIAGQTHNNIAKLLNHRGYRTKTGKIWTERIVGNLIKEIQTKS